jgi:hypothetical protein
MVKEIYRQRIEATMMSACGVLCSECPAYHGSNKGMEHQQRVVEAWHRIYALEEAPGNIACSGCLGPDEELFYTSHNCKARRCCQTKGFASCAECPVESCDDLEKAQSVWDDVPRLVNILTPIDFDIYARPYCDHRERLSVARATLQKS